MPDEPSTDHKVRMGARLRAARLAAGYQHASEVADLLGISQNQLTKWERGGNYPDYKELGRLCITFGVPTDFIINGKLDTVPYALAMRLRNLLPPDALNEPMEPIG